MPTPSAWKVYDKYGYYVRPMTREERFEWMRDRALRKLLGSVKRDTHPLRFVEESRWISAEKVDINMIPRYHR